MSRLLAVYFLEMLFGGTGASYFHWICGGQSFTLNCRNAVIDILSASYGRTRQGLCERNDGNTNCHAGTSMRVTRFECQQQHRCVLYAKNSAFGDPCKGIKNIWSVFCVHFKRDPSRDILLLREEEYQHHRGELYGRLTGGQICPGQIKTRYCGAARSQAKVRTSCQGKPQCVLQATNSIYGDPCNGTRKYLEVRYRC